ncbi:MULTISPECIES: glucose 1-dehydrogenase [unclassified Pseudomonas]|uniref:glucose 1-dehydrogenase n=1 Tax=unclassified Pseudomonas TaxID=196821 RepID=UPI002448EF56|nr:MULTISPECIES: glucose 1-dehydrogenase [unclassified Pseudomonas]MDH0893246.1 glucose 1-dehydrogenase [Pseudomonas sp. GD03875]MDH1064248.1 glucose 1-dehydrogenase [Pseudomonas sp. GD03985]
MTHYLEQMRLDGKVALVSGAARGLGAEIAEALLQAGASVMLSDVLVELGEQTASRLAAAHGGRAAFLRHDVTREADWIAAVDGTVDRFGGLDILVNNAGIETAALLAECELEDFQRTMAINVDGVFLGIKHALRAMRPGGASGRGGSIVNLSSVAGLVGTPGLGAYCASKGAVRLLTKAAAIEAARLSYGVRINSLHPAIIKTDMGINVVSNMVRVGLAPDAASADAFVESLHPLGYGLPRDVAAAVLYLASPAADWMTGAELVLDGGATAC